jgi:hypothetical protein
VASRGVVNDGIVTTAVALQIHLTSTGKMGEFDASLVPWQSKEREHVKQQSAA